MDIKSFNLWDEYTLARDAMFKATDTARRRGLWRAQKIKTGAAEYYFASAFTDPL